MSKNKRLFGNLIQTHFQPEELRALCQSIGAPYTAYPTVDRNAFIRSLVSYTQKSKRVTHLNLIEQLQKVRPEVDWVSASQESNPTRISTTFRQALKRFLTIEDLMEVSSLLDLDHENLVGGTPATSARDVVSFAERRRMLPELVQKARELRPDLDWSKIG